MLARSSIALRQALRKRCIMNTSRMAFSADNTLLVPIEGKQDLPMEFQHGFSLNDAELASIQAKHDEFNQLCKRQLVEMNTNKINAIEDRKGDEGWEQHVEGDTLLALTKTFEFDSFEKANFFVQEVGSYCDKNDHHPEWRTEAGGTVVHVKLTSHFAGNTVSLLDYELAEQMNKSYSDTQSKFSMYPMFDQKKLLSLCVGVGSFVLLYSGFQYLTTTSYLTDVQRGQPLASTGISTDAVKPTINEEEVLKVGVDAYVEQNVMEHGLKEMERNRIPSNFNIKLR